MTKNYITRIHDRICKRRRRVSHTYYIRLYQAPIFKRCGDTRSRSSCTGYAVREQPDRRNGINRTRRGCVRRFNNRSLAEYYDSSFRKRTRAPVFVRCAPDDDVIIIIIVLLAWKNYKYYILIFPNPLIDNNTHWHSSTALFRQSVSPPPVSYCRIRRNNISIATFLV